MHKEYVSAFRKPTRSSIMCHTDSTEQILWYVKLNPINNNQLQDLAVYITEQYLLVRVCCLSVGRLSVQSCHPRRHPV